MEPSKNNLNLPNEILMKIFTEAENNKNLSLVNKKFYHLITQLNEDNVKLNIKASHLLNLNFNMDEFLYKSSSIHVDISKYYKDLKNFDEKFLTFLKLHGDRVKSLIYQDDNEILNINKFIHLMPNLQAIEIIERQNEIHDENVLVIDEFKKHSVLLKKLTMENFSKSKVLDVLEIFDIEELEMNSDNDKDDALLSRYIRFISKMNNLSAYAGFCNQELLNVLAEKRLESINLDVKALKKKNIQEFLKNQTNLKSLKVENVNDNMLLTICENMINLEKLDISYNEIKKESFLKISNFTSLKSLQIQQNKQGESHIKELYTLKLPNLSFLGLRLSQSFSFELIAKKFKNLKELSISLPISKYKKGDVSKIFEMFNQVESLSISTWENKIIKLDNDFFMTQHSNKNLVKVKLAVTIGNIKNWLQKVKNDFPNAEQFSDCLYKDDLLKEYCLKYYEQARKTFNDTKRHLFFISFNTIDNANELFKNCSFEFKIYMSTFFNGIYKVIRDGKNQTTLSVQEYFLYSQLQAMLYTPRKLKFIGISLGVEKNQFAIENYVNYLKSVGQHVETLTMYGKYFLDSEDYFLFTPYQLQKTIEVFPCLRKIILIDINFKSFEKNSYDIRNKNVKEILLFFCLVKRQKVVESLKSFFNCIIFPDNSLEYFKITHGLRENELSPLNSIIIQNSIKNQKLPKYEEKYGLENDIRAYTYETWSK